MQKAKNNITNVRALVGILSSALILVLLALTMEGKVQQEWQDKQLAAALLSVPQETVVSSEIITADVQAQAAIVYDIQRGKVLYSKNADVQLPLASLTKLVTALVAESQIGAMAPVLVTEQALDTEGESGLRAGDIWREGDLSDFMLTVSSNDAAAVLASNTGTRSAFIAQMNQLVTSLGLQTMVLFNESGLDISNKEAGAYGSARDVAYLFTYATIVKPRLLEATTIAHFNSVSSTGLRYPAVNTNKIVGKIPGFVGGKTGYTDIAGGNLAVVFDAGIGRHIVIVVLGSSKEGRFDDVLRLVNSVLR